MNQHGAHPRLVNPNAPAYPVAGQQQSATKFTEIEPHLNPNPPGVVLYNKHGQRYQDVVVHDVRHFHNGVPIESVRSWYNPSCFLTSGRPFTLKFKNLNNFCSCFFDFETETMTMSLFSSIFRKIIKNRFAPFEQTAERVRQQSSSGPIDTTGPEWFTFPKVAENN